MRGMRACRFFFGHACCTGPYRGTLCKPSFAGVKHLRTLWLMRHGHAVASGGMPDEERMLSSQGQTQVQHAARAMARAGFVPDTIWHSPYLRAQQTADAISSAFPHADRVVAPGWVPHGRAPALVTELLENAPDRLLVVSHLPLLPEVLSALLAQPRSLDFSTATVAHCVLPSRRGTHFPASLVGLYAGEVLGCWGKESLGADSES